MSSDNQNDLKRQRAPPGVPAFFSFQPIILIVKLNDYHAKKNNIVEVNKHLNILHL